MRPNTQTDDRTDTKNDAYTREALTNLYSRGGRPPRGERDE